MEGSVTAEQLQKYVARYNLKDHFEKLKQIDFFSEFLLLPNKKTNEKSNQVFIETVEKYEAILFLPEDLLAGLSQIMLGQRKKSSKI